MGVRAGLVVLLSPALHCVLLPFLPLPSPLSLQYDFLVLYSERESSGRVTNLAKIKDNSSGGSRRHWKEKMAQ